eukprot:symbB.v1.2.025593.t1/scaffold2493.1/size77834/6
MTPKTAMAVESIASIFLAIILGYGLFVFANLVPASVAFVLCSQVMAWALKMKLESRPSQRNSLSLSRFVPRLPGK